MAKTSSFSIVRLMTGIFFLMLGIIGLGIIKGDLGMFEFKAPKDFDWLPTVFAVVNMVCGIFLILWCFGIIPSNILSMGTLAITICWAAQIVLTKIVWGMKFNNGVTIKGDMSEWLLALVAELLVLVILLPQNNK
ncbi:MAG: hypothetical protein II220_07090 [Spirochaetales bacterium]|nr:hypothetical protein [Spirochaetales bacterium]